MKSPQLDAGDGFDGQGEPDPSIAADEPWPNFSGSLVKYRDI